MIRQGLTALLLWAGATLCASPVAQTVELAPGDNALKASIVLGSDEKKSNRKLEILLADGKKSVTILSSKPVKFDYDIMRDKKKVREKNAVIEDGILTFFADRYCFPNPRRYTELQRGELWEKRAEYPTARTIVTHLELRQRPGGIAVYLNGSYIRFLKLASPMKSITLTLPETGSIRDTASFKVPDESRYTQLDLKQLNHPGPLTGAKLNQTPQSNIPFNTEGSADVGIVKEMKGSWALECDEHLSRTVLDGMRESLHFAVPKRFYHRAHVLCTVLPDPKKDPVLTARLTRFAYSGRGEAICDTSVTLPENGKQVGTVEKDGKTYPLYLVTFDLNPGNILDLLNMNSDPYASMMRDPYLDFEFLGKLDSNHGMSDSSHKPLKKSVSSVQVLAATLEHLPFELNFTPSQPGNIYHNDEKPDAKITVKALAPCDFTLNAIVSDINGKELKRVSRRFRLNAGASEDWTLNQQMPKPGYYNLTLEAPQLFRHEASFALLGKDTRKAEYDSPFGTWWFNGCHYGTDDPKIAGPMLFKAGLRKTTFLWTKQSEKDFAQWKVTSNQIPWGNVPQKESDAAGSEKKIKAWLERFPHCNSVNIFHESHPHYVPAAFRGEEPKETPEQIKRFKEKAERGNFAAKFLREKFPQLKIVFGNSWHSASITDDLARHGFQLNQIDSIGIEVLGQTGLPEKFWDHGVLGGSWITRETAKKHGGSGKLTGCFEFTGRLEKNLGVHRQATWLVRDMLIGLAFGYDNVSPALLYDASNAYANSRWGAGGICRRYPLLYPKPAYVGFATLTKALDQAKIIRQVPTGSNVVYALEFQRKDGRYVYALWLPRGSAEVSVVFPKKTETETFAFYGETQRENSRALKRTVSDAPSYLVAGARAEQIKVIRPVPEKDPADFKIAESMNDLRKWRHDNADMGLLRDNATELPLRKVGEFQIREADDPEQGKCLELELIRKGSLPELMGEYTTIRLKNPVSVPGTPEAVAVRVKGDGSWSKIAFEIQDAKGQLLRTNGYWHDWPDDLAVNFDGWKLIRFPLRRHWFLSPSPAWEGSFRGENPIAYPIKLVGLYITMNRSTHTLTERIPASGKLRLKDFGTLEKYEWE